MNNHKNEDVRKNITSREPIVLCRFKTRYDEFLESGKLQLEAMHPKSFGYDELRRMVNRLEKYKDSMIHTFRLYGS